MVFAAHLVSKLKLQIFELLWQSNFNHVT